jgi:hypothetical protein
MITGQLKTDNGGAEKLASGSGVVTVIGVRPHCLVFVGCLSFFIFLA